MEAPLTLSGSEAMEATLKLARQYFYENNKQTTRVNFIAREGSYHGNTIGALGVSGHVSRKAPYLPFLMKNVHHVSACNSYRQRQKGESDASFVARKAAELEAKFQELGRNSNRFHRRACSWSRVGVCSFRPRIPEGNEGYMP